MPDEKGMPKDLVEILAPLPGCNSFLICSGGFRFASTTGYSLPALRADVQPWAGIGERFQRYSFSVKSSQKWMAFRFLCRALTRRSLLAVLFYPLTGKADDSRCRITVQVSRLAFDSTAPNLMSHYKRNELATTRMKSHEGVSTEGTLWMDFLVGVVGFRSDSVERLRSAPAILALVHFQAYVHQYLRSSICKANC
jgi:hypothetical protein